MKRKSLTVTLRIDSYIADPYWPESAAVIDIQKKSGMNRCQTDKTREKALKAYLDKEGITLKDYERLVELRKRPWYRADNFDESSPIVIPRHHISAALVQTVKTAPSAAKAGYKEDSLRHMIQLSDFATIPNAKTAMRSWERFVKLDASNQRSLQKNEVMENFECAGVAMVHHETKIKDLETLFAWMVEEVGVGASRKMGYGRGDLVSVVEAVD